MWVVPEHLTIVLRGWACLRAAQGGGHHSVVDVAGPGDLISPLHALTPEPPTWLGPTATIRAHMLTKGRILQIPREMIPGVTHAPVLHRLLTHFSGQHQHALLHLHASSHLDVAARLARLLRQLWQRFGERRTPNGTALALPLSQADLASWIGASASAVARTLACWRAQHIIETGYSLIRILNPDALRTLAAYPPPSLAEPARTVPTPPTLTGDFLPFGKTDLPPGLGDP
ncbi:helix-turn-helix domain-containing protein [Nonomuraea sp. NPDC050540]|uniref:helix-turn-helix domain-containing protein n=1 Tax=Nonomuraea sp. NPDC050540 TaxID=3364367 RepID=UPI0037B171FD